MTTPICRCRVMYLGSAVPHVTKDGLQGIQEPLRDLYPENGVAENGSFGIDSWVSVWSNGILIENVDDTGKKVKRFFPIESLHYCAAVRYVMVPSNNDSSDKSYEKVSKFLPLDSPFLRNADTKHPPLFACILRRTAGIKVLECHAFICKREPAANALVRCCFHAYADSIYAKQIDENPYSQLNGGRRSRSISALDTVDKAHNWNGSSKEGTPESSRLQNGHSSKTPSEVGATSTISQSPDEDNYKVWPGVVPLEREVNSSFRTAKPRQMIIPSVLPPPPLPPMSAIPLCAEKIKGFSNSMKKRKKRHKNGTVMPLIYPPHIVGGGFPVNFVSVPQLHPQGPPHPIYTPASSVYSLNRRLKRAPAMIPQEIPIMFAPNEEPLYIPPMRPLTPLSNYPPQLDPHYVQFPMQTYGTSSRKDRSRKERKKNETNNCDSDSPFNTGIYRKKGHLNERAFSYSIRQEHRSRSNSLANIQFDESEKRSHHSDYNQERVNGHNGHSVQNGNRHVVSKQTASDVKREKELSQSLSTLHINGSSDVNSKVMKTASIKRGKQNGSTGKIAPVAPPVPAPPPMPPAMNGKTVSSEHTQLSKRTKSSSSGKQCSK